MCLFAYVKGCVYILVCAHLNIYTHSFLVVPAWLHLYLFIGWPWNSRQLERKTFSFIAPRQELKLVFTRTPRSIGKGWGGDWRLLGSYEKNWNSIAQLWPKTLCGSQTNTKTISESQCNIHFRIYKTTLKSTFRAPSEFWGQTRCKGDGSRMESVCLLNILQCNLYLLL